MPNSSDRIAPEGGHGEREVVIRTDAAQGVAATVKARIAHHPHLKTQRIWCEFDGETLFLRGHVPSFFFKQLAQQAIVGLDSVRQVVNEIEVVW